MKVALIGDIHANLPALETVLEDAHKRKVDAIWNVGDIVGYGAFPEEVVQRLKNDNVMTIIGNYDLKVLKVESRKQQNKKHSRKWFAFNWAYENLSESRREYLSSLPKEIRMEEAGKRILITHGSPESNEEYISPDTPAERLQELADITQADIVISGHSHRTFKQKVDGVWFINTGSVGRPDDGDPRAAYAIMHLRPRFFQIRHYRIEYDVERAVDAIREKGLPETFAQMIQQGRSLDYILENAEIQQEKEILQDIPISDFKPDEQTLKSIMELAQSCEYEAVHTKQVTELALRLFDEMRPVHYLDEKEKFWLQAGALLHDIGWIEGQKGHHKTSLRIILGNSILTMDNHERLVIGSIARYHRKALPKMKHSHYNALQPIERQTVNMLAGILRVADGLDRTHKSIVRDLKCDINKNKITIICSVDSPAGIEHRAALKKSDLMEKVFKRKVIFKFQNN